ncbi:MAG: hypothetical protein MJ060_00185 [Clostridia bacterium]|nr:hypothetical protein [Clostridia bacterium]
MFMRKVWTRLASIVLILVVAISFSACSLFTINLDKKYSATTKVVTAAGDEISISRQELYYGYLQWGYQYASYYSSTDELLEYIALALMNNKILEQKSIEQFGELREAEKALAMRQAYQSLDSALRQALEIEDETTNTENEEDEVDQPYQPHLIVGYENGERVYTMDLSSYADEEGLGMLSKNDYKTYVPAIPGATSTKSVKQGISKIVRNLQTLENGFTQLKTPATDYLADSEYFKNLTDAERAVLNREIDRMVKLNQTTILIDRLNVAYNLGLFTLSGDDAKVAWDAYLIRGSRFAAWCDEINGIKTEATEQRADFGCGRTIAMNIANEAIAYYQQKVADTINNQKNFPDPNLESTVMSSGLADVYYLPQNIANNLFTVSHILVGFTDEQKAEYKRIESEKTKNPSYNAQNDLNKLYAATKSNDVSAFDVLLEVQTALEKLDDLNAKCKTFREYINKYNSDPGMQNLEQLDSNSKPKHEYLMSGTAENNQMVEKFTEASIELFDAGIKGEISGLVWTEYGAHIIMYTRDVADFIFTGVKGLEDTSINLLKNNYADTLFATLTSYGQRTMFDTLVDTYFTRSYANYRNYLLNDYRNEHQITVVNSEFKDFLKK